MNAHMISKFHQASSAIATHAAFPAIGIKVDHFKIVTIFFAKQHQAIGANTKVPVTNGFNLLGT